MESLPILSRNPSRNTERDWENASTASSIASVAEYTGACFVLAFVLFVSFICYKYQVRKTCGVFHVIFEKLSVYFVLFNISQTKSS